MWLIVVFCGLLYFAWNLFIAVTWIVDYKRGWKRTVMFFVMLFFGLPLLFIAVIVGIGMIVVDAIKEGFER